MRYRRMRVAGGIYAFTVVTRDRWPIFGTDDAVALVLATLRHVQSGHPFELDAYVILPDHLHMIWTLPEDDSDFSTRWMLIKKAFTRRYKVLTNSAGGHGLHPSKTSTIWQNRFWEHLIRDERDYIAHIEYIHQNPVRHGRVKMPIDWPHSSFRAFVERGDYPANWENRDLPDPPKGFGE